MRRLFTFLSLTLLLTCAKEDSQAPNTPPTQVIKNYTLTVSAGDGGSVSTTGGSFASGTQVSITATPNSGYTFSGWSNGSTANPFTVTLNSNTSITANFALIPVYAITISSEDGGSVSSNGGEYQQGTQLTLTATPNEGYEFSGWSDGNTEATRVITASENLTLTASFSELIISYTLTVTSWEGGSVNSEGGEYNEGTEITLTASAGEGYRFIGWSDGSTEETITITLSEDTTLEALFELIPVYTVTVTAEGGEVTGAGEYQEGTEVTITATPDEGYEFTGWSDGETSLSRVVTINSDTTLSASFEILTFQLTIVDTEGGTVSVETGSYDYGTELTIVASPNENYHFVEFTGYPKRQNEISVTINEDTTLTPNFLVKHDGVKTRNNYWYLESELEFLASENFIVWWDKDYDYLLRAISVLEEFENVMSIANINGWGLPYSKLIPGLDASNHLMSLYIYTGGDSSDIIFESGKARCCGVGGNELEGMPYTGMDASFFNILDDGSFKLRMGIRMTLIHEAFHMMQFSMPLNNNGGNTFTYSGDSSWWTESTARWFERKYGISDWDGNWATKYNSLATQHLQPQVSLWTHRNPLPNRGLNSNQTWSFGMNGYEKGELFRFLIQESYVPTSYVWDMGVSKSTLLPQEYLYQTINNFEDVYGDYAVKFTSGIMYNDIEVEAAKSSLEYWINNSCNNGINCNTETNEAFNNQYVAEINEAGTNGYVTPVEKNQAWSWTVVKINTSQQQSFTLDFQPDELGNEGTQSNFKLYLTNRENNLVQQVNFNGEINVDPNLDYFLVMVNTPQRFEGRETFDYQLKVTPVN